MVQEYQYKPLTEPDSIRLIELQPSSNSAATIRCSLIHTTLSTDKLQDIFGHYTALSYVWGCPDKVDTVWIDNVPLKITANLLSALRELRDEKNSFLLWADGICINQDNAEEKGFQVQLMGRIYQGAKNTIVYLGPTYDESNESQFLRLAREGEYRKKPSEAQQLSILNKEWFTRVWVFQELVFAANPWVQCGKIRARWRNVYHLMLIGAASLDDHKNRKLDIVSQMFETWKFHQRGQTVVYLGADGLPDDELTRLKRRQFSQNSMLELVCARRGLGVSDPRDMIFAHSGFASDGSRNFKVDYSKTCERVYVDFALYVIDKVGIGTVLGLVGDPMSHRRRKDLPSWVPDWTSPFVSPMMFPWPIQRSLDTFALKFSRLPKIVFATFETISIVSSELQIAQTPSELRQNLESNSLDLRVSLSGGCIHGLGHTLPTLYTKWNEVYQMLKTVADDSALDFLLSEPPYEHNDMFRACTIHQDCRMIEYTVYAFLALAFETHLKLDFLTGRALALTKSGQLALVPKICREGDLIVHVPCHESHSSSGRFKSFVFRPLRRLAVWRKTTSLEDTDNVNTAGTIPDVLCDFIGEGFYRWFSTLARDKIVLTLN